MKILLIGYSDVIIDEIQNNLLTLNHNIKRINLYISDNFHDLSRTRSKVDELNLRNFHDITIELIEFNPEISVYFPMKLLEISNLNLIEIFSIIYDELVEHLLESVKVVNCKLKVVEIMSSHLDFKDNHILQNELREIMQTGVDKIQNFPKSTFYKRNTDSNNISQIIDLILE